MPAAFLPYDTPRARMTEALHRHMGAPPSRSLSLSFWTRAYRRVPLQTEAPAPAMESVETLARVLDCIRRWRLPGIRSMRGSVHPCTLLSALHSLPHEMRSVLPRVLALIIFEFDCKSSYPRFARPRATTPRFALRIEGLASFVTQRRVYELAQLYSISFACDRFRFLGAMVHGTLWITNRLVRLRLPFPRPPPLPLAFPLRVSCRPRHDRHTYLPPRFPSPLALLILIFAFCFNHPHHRIIQPQINLTSSILSQQKDRSRSRAPFRRRICARPNYCAALTFTSPTVFLTFLASLPFFVTFSYPLPVGGGWCLCSRLFMCMVVVLAHVVRQRGVGEPWFLFCSLLVSLLPTIHNFERFLSLSIPFLFLFL
ncbi:hypothetical protein K438DRAFT_1984771 [Mycena galopus ATCC 62051]|nr:hypothetical protein K438DRAFT_1984771 [Mycena galopus ATCC 62051]